MRRWGDRADDKIAALDDRCECLRVLAAGSQSMQDLEQQIVGLFAEANPGEAPKQFVTFGSIHKSKGLEANRVWILRSDLIPHPMAKQPWEVDAEKRICYVAVTRARSELKFVGQIPRCLQQLD
jgi:superfamily I DNA/RNA helicase